MSSLNSNADGRARRSRRTLWLLVAVCAAPILASYIAYYFWRPSGQVNYGTLLEPRPLPDAGLERPDGRAFRFSDLKGEWILLTVDSAACDERCRTKLVYMRQVRLAQAKESERIERVWILTDSGVPDPRLIEMHPGLHVLRARAGELVKALPAPGSPADHIYVIDPLANLMMRFPVDPDPRRMLKDLSRLLRHSKWK